jgi:hypothetical protein
MKLARAAKRAAIFVALSLGASLTLGSLSALAQTPPQAGPVGIFPLAGIRPGQQATAWTVFQGTEPEAIPIEIIGVWKNAWGPRQDVILGKMGGKAQRTGVAGGMSGSPVYIDGRLVGAVALRLSTFSPDAICGITPIEAMLEIDALDRSQPADARAPQAAPPHASLMAPAGLLPQWAASAPALAPIDTPLSFAGFRESALREFAPVFASLGVVPALGGAAGNAVSAEPEPGWEHALRPGQVIAGVLVNGDLAITGLGTATYNDGKRVLGFGHNLFNLGAVSIPMSSGEVVHVLASSYQPNKFANATGIVGALRQDRHSGILGVLGERAEMIPVELTVRAHNGAAPSEKQLHFNVFVHPKWTPFLMLLTTYNSLQDLNDLASDEATYTLKGRIEFDKLGTLEVEDRVTSADAPMPPPLLLATWWSERFQRVFALSEEAPRIRKVSATIEMRPRREMVTIESALLDASEVEPGGEVRGRVTLRPWRGEAYTREFRLKVPLAMVRGEHRILISDSDVLNRVFHAAALADRRMTPAEAVNLMREEQPNTLVQVTLLEARPTLYDDDRTSPALPATVLNVMSSTHQSAAPVINNETIRGSVAFPADGVVGGSLSLRLTVK